MPTPLDRSTLSLHAHARARLRQRGMTEFWLNALLLHADRSVPVGDGCIALSVSRHALDEAQAEGASPADMDKLRRRVAVLDGRGRVVTVFPRQGRRARRYASPDGRPRHSRGRAR